MRGCIHSMEKIKFSKEENKYMTFKMPKYGIFMNEKEWQET